nr:beta-tubulin [Glyphodes caesalis]
MRLSARIPAHTLSWWRHRLRYGNAPHLKDP